MAVIPHPILLSHATLKVFSDLPHAPFLKHQPFENQVHIFETHLCIPQHSLLAFFLVVDSLLLKIHLFFKRDCKWTTKITWHKLRATLKINLKCKKK